MVKSVDGPTRLLQFANRFVINGTLANLDHEGKNSNILNGDFLYDHSEPLGEVLHMPLDMLALWHLFRFTGSDQL